MSNKLPEGEEIPNRLYHEHNRWVAYGFFADDTGIISDFFKEVPWEWWSFLSYNPETTVATAPNGGAITHVRVTRRTLPPGPIRATVLPSPPIVSNRGGRPGKFDWDDFWIEVVRVAELDNLPPRAALQRHMMEYTGANWEGPPDESEVRRRLRRLYGEPWAPRE